VRLAEARLSSQQRNAERAALDSAQQLDAEALVHLGKIHVWKIRHRAWRQTVSLFLQQTELGRLTFIQGIRWLDGMKR
jgi:DNA-binding response OmpR family regulator